MDMISSYKELLIGKYRKIMDLCRDESLSHFNMQMAVFSVLSDMSEDVLLDMPITEFQKIALAATFLEKDIPEQDGHKVAAVYRIGIWELIPDLDVSKLTTAQYVDFQMFCKEDGNIAQLLSCFLIPKGCKYGRGYDIAQVHEALETELSIYDASVLTAFFLKKCQRSINGILTSSIRDTRTLPKAVRKEVKAKVMEMKVLLSGAGAGLQMSMLFPNWYAVRGMMCGR